MDDKIKSTIEFTKDDRRYLDIYREDVEQLYGVVIEMMTVHQSMLLSPVFREMLLRTARDVERKHRAIHFMLCIDNPGPPLQPVDTPHTDT